MKKTTCIKLDTENKTIEESFIELLEKLSLQG